MNKLTVFNQDGQLVVSSREIAENFEKEHFNVVRDIDNLLKGEPLKIEGLKYFIPSTFTHNGNGYREYLLTRDGFSLLVMGFTGPKSLEWKLKYIQAFNKMEQSLINGQPKLSKELQAIFQLDKMTMEVKSRIEKTESRINNLENDMPLFTVECKELQALVRKVGIKALGGYRSHAYCDNSLRGLIYRDIQQQLKREFGVERYEGIKRCQLDTAKTIVNEYRTPIVLVNEILITNSQMTSN